MKTFAEWHSDRVLQEALEVTDEGWGWEVSGHVYETACHITSYPVEYYCNATISHHGREKTTKKNIRGDWRNKKQLSIQEDVWGWEVSGPVRQVADILQKFHPQYEVLASVEHGNWKDDWESDRPIATHQSQTS